MSDHFYSRLDPFTQFTQSASSRHYTSVPDEWSIVVTDVVASTSAIEQGLYKEVNAVAVASITALINAVKPVTIPFVFGGDGMTAAIPDTLTAMVKPALIASRKMAQEEFGLDLRIGLVPLRVIRETGEDVRVAKFQVNPNYTQAMFMGSGVALAERLVKSDEDGRFSIQEHADEIPDIFEGFECRWNTIPTPRDENISLLVEPCDSENEVLGDIIGSIETLYDGPDHYHPVREHQISLTNRPRLLKVESLIRTTTRRPKRWFRYMLKLQLIRYIGMLLMRFGIRTKETNWGRYSYHFVQNSDFRKMDGALRMIIAGSKSQHQALVELLEQYRGDGRIYYGYHLSRASLVTCIVTRYEKAHLHLLDGADGGYAIAAKMLKQQKRGSLA